MQTRLLLPLLLFASWLSDMINWCILHILLPLITTMMKRESEKISVRSALEGVPAVFLTRFATRDMLGDPQYQWTTKYLLTLAKCCPNQGLTPLRFIGLKEKIVVFRAETAQAVMSTKACYMQRPAEYQVFRDVLSATTCIDDPEEWRLRRKFLIPWFHNRNIERFIPSMNKHSEIFARRLRSRDGVPVNIYSYVHEFALDFAFDIILGHELGFQSPTTLSEEVKEAITVVFEEAFLRPVNPLLYNDYIFSLLPRGRKYFKSLRYFRNFLRQVIRDREQNLAIETSRDENGTIVSEESGICLLDHSLQSMRKQNAKRIREENELIALLITFILGAEDTCHHALSMALLLIGHHPEVQSKIHQELDYVFMGDRERPTKPEDIKKLEYLQCVIKETLRLYPPGEYVAFSIYPPGPFKIGDHEFMPGTDFVIAMSLIHRDPKYFPSPERFIPERFVASSPYNVPKHPYAFLPFSGGPRNCMGNRIAYDLMSIVLSHILRNFSIHSLDKRDQLRFSGGVIPSPVVPLRAYFSPRQGCSPVSSK